MSKKTFFVGLSLMLVVLLFCVSYGKTNLQKEIYVAVISSLTGGLAENGKDMANGAKLAFDQQNDAKSSNAIRIHYEFFDDNGDPKTAVSIANRIIRDRRFVAVVGHLTSGAMAAAAPVYDRAGMPVVMPVPTNPKITQQGFTSLFRIPPTDDEQAPFLARYLISHDPKAPVAVVNDLTAYGMGFAMAFQKAFEASGGTILAFEGAQKESRDFRSLITKLKSLNPKYIILGATYDMGAPFIRQMKELGLSAIIISGDGCYGSALLEQAGDAAEGAIVSFIAPDRGFSTASNKFFEEYEAKYGKVVSFAPLGYDAAKVIIAAASKANKKTRKGILDELRAKQFAVEGVSGKIAFAKNGDNKNKNLVLYVVRNGKFILLK